MDSRVRTRAVSRKEWILGHLVGPLGLIFVVNTIAALVEKFFTQQTGAMYGVDNVEMVMTMGGRYEVVMTVAKVLAVGFGLLNGWLIQHTQSRQGRLRPWHLLFGFVSIAIGCLIFLFPGTTLGESYWYYFFFLLICYHTVGSSLSVFQGGMGVVRCVRIDLFKAVLGFSKLDAAFMFPAGAKGGGAVPRRRLLDNIL